MNNQGNKNVTTNSIVEDEFVSNHSQDYLNHFKKLPAANVLGKEAYEQRTAEVFHVLWTTLSKSFGPYGANTTILNYPFSHLTKDGFTIMKNLMMDTSQTLIDQSISNLASDICGRLNYAVGDGTTTAIIATYGIYNRYMQSKKFLSDKSILPRDVTTYYKNIINKVTDELMRKAKSIQTDDSDALYKNIYDVVYISSNGNEEISDYIASFYKELHCPAISAILSPDGVTRATLINGYQLSAVLSDKLYINSDDETMTLPEADIVIFTVTVTKRIYENIVKPMNEASRARGRHLICFAPNYDMVLMNTIVQAELGAEYHKKKDVNLVLMRYLAIGKYERNMIEDFAVLCNTTTLDMSRCNDIIRQMEEGKSFSKLFGMDDRLDIPNIQMIMCDDSGHSYITSTTDFNEVSSNPSFKYEPYISGLYRVGYARDISLGLKKSVVRTFFYDKLKYNSVLNDAKDELDDLIEKFKNLGTFNTDVAKSQLRYYSLGLKVGLIEVGGQSTLSQKCEKDIVDDAVRAAESAYNYGIVNGCNATLIKVLHSMITAMKYSEHSNATDTDIELVNILFEGFLDVHRTILANAFPDEIIISGNDIVGLQSIYKDSGKVNRIKEYLDDYYTSKHLENPFDYEDSAFENTIKDIWRTYHEISYFNMLIYYGMYKNQVYDLSKKTFSSSVVNSVQTDTEVLKASVDLISMLIVSNQLLMTNKNNFQ